jgi:hypothetical protein
VRSVQGSNFTKALKAIAVVHRFFAIESEWSEGNLNFPHFHCVFSLLHNMYILCTIPDTEKVIEIRLHHGALVLPATPVENYPFFHPSNLQSDRGIHPPPVVK